MALNLNDKYPGRANPPSIDYPEGSIKNQTAPGAKDGTPLDADWANDKEGFFQSLLSKAGAIANGVVDKVGASQYYDALMRLINNPEQPIITGNATLTGSDNKIAMSNIVSGIQLEKGDVVQVTISGISYDKLHTVESLIDGSSIVVNYEHCGSRGNGSLKLPDYTGSVTIKRIAKWHSAAEGLGQAWVSVYSTRSFGVGIPNTTGRTIAFGLSSILVSPSGSKDLQVLVDGVEVGYADVSNSSVVATIGGDLPSGSSYSVSSTGTKRNWAERR